MFLTMMPTLSFSAEWSVAPSIAIKGYYNSNLLLTPLPHEATYGYWISPKAEFATRTENLEVSGQTALDFVDYYGGRQTQFTNVFFPLSLRYTNETNIFSFNGGLTRDNTLMSELLTTGVVLQFTQRNLWTANPTWKRNLTEKLALQGSIQFSDVAYENGLRLGLVNYQLMGGSAGLLYQWNERDQIQLSGSYTKFQTLNAAIGLRVNLPGITLNLRHAFTETLLATVYGGPRFIGSTTELPSNSEHVSDTVWVYGANLTKQFEDSSIQFNFSRDVLPSGFGLLIRTDRIGVTASHKFSDNLTASLDGSGYFTSVVATSTRTSSFADSRYFYVTPRIAWHFSEWWKLEASYTYGWRDLVGPIEPAMSNSTIVMLTYYPYKTTMSY